MECIINGCTNNRMSSGYGRYKKLCTKHHKEKYKMPDNPVRRRKGQVINVSYESCERCGWNESYCDTHRIIKGKDGGKYTEDNVIPLCPNCHRIEHLKKTPSTGVNK